MEEALEIEGPLRNLFHSTTDVAELRREGSRCSFGSERHLISCEVCTFASAPRIADSTIQVRPQLNDPDVRLLDQVVLEDLTQQFALTENQHDVAKSLELEEVMR